MFKRHLPFIAVSAFCVFFYFGFSFAQGGKPIEYDEVIQFFTSYGIKTNLGTKILVQGRVFEPAKNSKKYELFIKAMIELIDLEKHEVESEIFRERMRQFLADGEGDRLVQVEIANQIFPLEITDGSGYVNMFVDATTLSGTVNFSSLPSKVNPNRYPGAAHIIDAAGYSVISDIDDTIKITDVRNKKEMLRNTFVRPFRAAPGMPELYQNWKKQFGEEIQFHFLSGSPWQLYEPLVNFAKENKFPDAAWHLRNVNSLDDLQAPPAEFKVPNIRAILKNFPQRKFILVGDSGEQDPEIYAQIVSEFGSQVIGVFIRDVTGETQESPRYANLYKGFNGLKVFQTTDEVPPLSH